MTETTNPEMGVEEDIDSRLMNAFEPEESEAPEESDDFEAEDATEEAAEETEEPAEPEEEFEEIVWNGQSKKLKKSELKELAQKGFDYTQKTQELAEQRRALEAERQAIKFQQEFQQETLQAFTDLHALDLAINAASQRDWNTLKQTDPATYMTEMMNLQNMRQQRQEIAGWIENARHQALQQQQAKRLEQRQQALQRVRQKIPDYTDEVDRALDEYVRQQGFEPWEIAEFFDDRSAILAYKAWKYDQLQAKRPDIEKRVSQSPKPIKPGSRVNPNAEAYKKARQAMKKGDSAAELAVFKRFI